MRRPIAIPLQRSFWLINFLPILSQVVEAKLWYQRDSLNLLGFSDGTRRASVLADIQLDSQADSQYLTGWSLLYYRYVRGDLNITMDEYAANCGVVLRTRRRYRAASTKLLTDHLTDREWETRV